MISEIYILANFTFELFSVRDDLTADDLESLLREFVYEEACGSIDNVRNWMKEEVYATSSQQQPRRRYEAIPQAPRKRASPVRRR